MGSFDDCRGNGVTVGETRVRTIKVNVPAGRKITLAIAYFYENDNQLKQSNDISCDISTAGSYVIDLGFTSWSDDHHFNGATIHAKS